jgi:hypothetical protein
MRNRNTKVVSKPQASAPITQLSRLRCHTTLHRRISKLIGLFRQCQNPFEPKCILSHILFCFIVCVCLRSSCLAQSQWQRNEKPLLSNFNNMYNPCVVETDGQWRYKMWFFGWSGHHANEGMGWGCDAIFHARSQDLENWAVWCGENRWDFSMTPKLWRPVLFASEKWFDAWHNGDPSVVVDHGRYYMAYSATSKPFTKKMAGYPSDMVQCVMGASSEDGIVWTKSAEPLLIRKEDTSNPSADPQRIGDYHRPCLRREHGIWKLWFDYWVPGHGACLGFAENRGGFYDPDGFQVAHPLEKPLLDNWPNPEVIRIGDQWHSFSDPGGYPVPFGIKPDAAAWMGRQLREAISKDGLTWTRLDFIAPDRDTPACHVPQALLAEVQGRKWLYLFYATQRGFKPNDGTYHYQYDSIRTMRRAVE